MWSWTSIPLLIELNFYWITTGVQGEAREGEGGILQGEGADAAVDQKQGAGVGTPSHGRSRARCVFYLIKATPLEINP